MPFHRLGGDPERGQELEVLILHVLVLVRRDLCIGEEPVEIARARVVEAELHRGAGEGGDDAGFEVDLKIDDEVELAGSELAADIQKPAQSVAALEENDLVHRAVAAHQRGGHRLQDPRDLARRIVTFERVDDWQHVHGVAGGAHHDDGDAVQAWRCHGAVS